MALEPYPAYKPSGIPWLGEIPAHWKINKLKRNGFFKSGAGFPIDYQGDNENLIPFYKVSDMNLKDNEINLSISTNTISKSIAKELGAFVFPKNTIIFPKVGAALLTNKRRILSKPACIDNNIMGFFNYSLEKKFTYYYFCTKDFSILSNPGAVPSINESQVKDIYMCVPPKKEQQSIAAFLDHHTARIDALIAKYRRLVALLEEQRAAIITRAVTKGLDLSAPMKDSGIPWLGEIPAHWEVNRIKNVSIIIMGQSPKSEECNSIGIGRPFLQGNVEFGEFYPAPRIFCETSNKLSKRGDFLLSVRAPVGALNISDQDFGIGRGLCAIRPYKELIKHKYMWFMLQFFRKQLDMISTGSTYEAVSISEISNAFCVLPSIKEQQSIAAFLNHHTERIDALKEKANQLIERWQEYRSALITAAVTGKIDVRGWSEKNHGL